MAKDSEFARAAVGQWPRSSCTPQGRTRRNQALDVQKTAAKRFQVSRCKGGPAGLKGGYRPAGRALLGAPVRLPFAGEAREPGRSARGCAGRPSAAAASATAANYLSRNGMSARKIVFGPAASALRPICPRLELAPRLRRDRVLPHYVCTRRQGLQRNIMENSPSRATHGQSAASPARKVPCRGL